MASRFLRKTEKIIGEGSSELCRVKVKETTSQHITDILSRTLRSWKFIFSQAIFITVWIGFNYFVPHWSFDNKSFDLLKLVLTIEASFTVPFLLMINNRHLEIDRKIIYSDYMLDYQMKQQLKEIRLMIEKVSEKLDIK